MGKVQLLLLTFPFAWVLLGTGCTVSEPGPESFLTVEDYRDPDIPTQVSTAPFEGENYSASVPDTLDLHIPRGTRPQRADLSSGPGAGLRTVLSDRFSQGSPSAN